MWWHKAIIYQIYVRSFYDANGDGIGDIAGVTAKLPYLERLGIDTIWLTPVTVSANRDWGYDVTDYYNIDPELGTMAELDTLIEAANKLGIRIVLDLVPNHTSIDHPWFVEARSSLQSPKRDWYIWAKKPNNWRSVFGGSAWTLDKATGEYYLHNFLPEQADLNWGNQEVRDEFERILDFWFQRGVAGFRIDVVNMLGKDPQLRDDPVLVKAPTLELRLFGRKQIHSGNGASVHRILRRWREIARQSRFERLLLGETMVYDVASMARYYGQGDELSLAFSYPFWLAPFKADSLKKIVAETEHHLKNTGWPVYTASNHDIVRAATRWAKGHPERHRLIMLMLLTLRGTPVLYYGDELGLTQSRVPRRAFQDRYGKRFWPFFSGRDGARTPLPWTEDTNKGFSHNANVTPWLPAKTSTPSVAEQVHDSQSTLAWTQAIIKLRRTTPDLTTGDYHELPAPAGVWAYQRGERTIVILNMTGREQHYQTTEAHDRTPHRHGRTGTDWVLTPWSGRVLELR